MNFITFYIKDTLSKVVKVKETQNIKDNTKHPNPTITLNGARL